MSGAARELVLANLVERIVGIDAGHPTRVAVDGPDMAGKTTLADELALRVESTGREVIRASVDDFHRPRIERYRRGRESPEGYYLDAFDVDQLTSVLLRPMGPAGDRTFSTAVFDHRTDAVIRQQRRAAPDDAVLVVDGVFLLRPELHSHWDLSIFVLTSPRVRLARSVIRDVDGGDSAEELERLFWTRYAPAHELYRRRVDPEALADVVVDNERPAAPRLRG